MRKKNDLSLDDITRYWNSNEFLLDMFGNNFNKTSTASNLVNTLNSLPLSYTYTIAAYGSLLNAKDIYRTMPSAKNFRAEYIYGYQRIFNMGSLETGCFLNIKKDYKENTLCRFIDISYEDLPEYILREGLYNITELRKAEYSVAIPDKQPVLTVIGKQYFINKSVGIEPQLNYMHMCLTGIKELAGMTGVNNFLNKTLCYSNDDYDYIPAKEWLYKLDITNYMISKNYSSR
jgi:hypothetical protein